MSKPCILVADGISPVGIAQLEQDPDLDVDVRTSITAEELLADAAKCRRLACAVESNTPARFVVGWVPFAW